MVASSGFAHAPGQLLAGTYRLERKIAEGGMGVVYEASHVRLPRRFAVKLLSKPSEGDVALELERFEREAQVTATLHSPHVVHVFDYQVGEDGHPFIVMELLDGEDLAKRIKRAGALRPGDALEILEQIGEALDAAHALGIVHRDLKPANVFLNREPTADYVKVLDFGISKMLDWATLTDTHSIVGTPLYMAPEQTARGTTPMTPASDLFSLGSIAYEILTGKRAFIADSIPAILYQVVHGEPAPVSEFLGQRVVGVDAVFAQALAKDPAKRFGTAAEFVGSLRAALRPLLPVRRLSSDQFTSPLGKLDEHLAEQCRTDLYEAPKVPGADISSVSAELVSADLQPLEVPPPVPGEESNPSLSASLLARGLTSQIVGAAAVFVVAVVLLVAVRHGRTHAPVVTTLAQPSAPLEPRVAHIGLRLSPADVLVEIDGKRVSGRELVLPLDDTPHVMRVTRAGFEAVERKLDATSDRDVDITLRALDLPEPAKADVRLAPPSRPAAQHVHKKAKGAQTYSAPVQDL